MVRSLLAGFVFFFSLSSVASVGESPLYHVGNRQAAPSTDHYLSKVQPILSARCVACHGCYEAPCQLNLENYEGLRRGYNASPIFSGLRFGNGKPTRPIDAQSIAEWRNKGFHPVIYSSDGVVEGEKEDPKSSLFYRLVDQSSKNNAPGFDIRALDDLQKKYDEAKPQCVATQDQMNRSFSTKASNLWGMRYVGDVLHENPLAGMPFALPRLDEDQDKLLKDWTAAGAKGPEAAAIAALNQPAQPALVAEWEAFFNGDSTKERQMARYIYEHVFTAHLFIEENPGEFFELVRSRTLSGAIDQIVTELPYHDPGVARVYYRLKKITRAIPAKNHFALRINRARMAHWKDLFLNAPEWKDAKVPAPDYSSPNPFQFFASIPARVRSRFLMENSRIIVAGMTQGSVCVGSTATYAIADHFWGWFLKPESDPSVQTPDLGLGHIGTLQTAPVTWAPATALDRLAVARINALLGSDVDKARKIVAEYHRLFKVESDKHTDETLQEIALRMVESKLTGVDIMGALNHYYRTAKANHQYQRAFEFNLRKMLKAKGRNSLALADLWTGDGDSSSPQGNPNAWINITRHGRSATVQYGEAGGVPQSIWVMSYSNFERLYYNLVASYKEWGSALHKMATWRHMSYVRLEGEDLAISFLPLEYRAEVRARFTRGLGMLKSVLHFPQWSTVGMSDGKHYNPLYHTPLYSWDLPPRPSPYKYKDADSSIEYLIGATTQLIRPLSKATLENEVGPERLAFEKKLEAISHRKEVTNKADRFAQFLPQVTYLKVEAANGETWAYSLNVDRGYKAHNVMLAEDKNRDPQYDQMTYYRGFVGNYPNAFVSIKEAQIDQFLKDTEEVTNQQYGNAWLRNWAISRNSDKFWPHFDWVHAYKATKSPGVDPVDQGIADLSQYELF